MLSCSPRDAYEHRHVMPVSRNHRSRGSKIIFHDVPCPRLGESVLPFCEGNHFCDERLKLDGAIFDEHHGPPP